MTVVVRRSVSEQVAEIIREEIVEGKLRPGQAVTHEDVSKRLGVSTMPVREALIRLANEGLVDAPRNRTFRVAAMSRDDLKDIYWLHGVIAGELAERACEAEGPALAKRLRVLEEETRGDHSANECERLFHREINLAAGAPKLVAALRGNIRFIPERFYEMVPEWAISSEASHQAIIAALAAQDAKAVKVANVEHMQSAVGLLIKYFEQVGFWEEDVPQATSASRIARPAS